MTIDVGQKVVFAGQPATVTDGAMRNGAPSVLIESGPLGIEMWVPAHILDDGEAAGALPVFHRRTPALLSVDDFFRDPDQIREIALNADYHEDLRYYKGLRSTQRYLWPFMREELSRLLGVEVSSWIDQSANGVFQQTRQDDPLVYHSDTQSYAAAVYLTPDAPVTVGTTFWRDKTYGCRRFPRSEPEAKRLGSDEAVEAAVAVVEDPVNLTSPDNWEVVESIAGLYNRLVIWDAKLIHSATSYADVGDDGVAPTRLVQLFFFEI